MEYIVKGRTLVHRVTGEEHKAGARIDLSHCTPEEIETLKKAGLIVEAEKKQQKGEVKNG